MKALRVLYMAIVYTIGLPLLAIFGVGVFGWLCIKNVRDLDKQLLKEMYEAAFDGMVIGHKCNMIWVKYGSKFDLDDVLKEFGA